MLRFSRSRAAVAQSLCQAVRVKTEDANQRAFPFKLNHTKRGHERGLTGAAEGCCAWPQAGPSGCQAQRSDKEEGGGKGGSRPASPSPTRQLAAPERRGGSARRATALRVGASGSGPSNCLVQHSDEEEGVSSAICVQYEKK